MATYDPSLRLSRADELNVLRRLHKLETDLNASIKAAAQAEAPKAEAPKTKGKSSEKATSAAAATPAYQCGHFHYQGCANDTPERKGKHDCACQGTLRVFQANSNLPPQT